MSFEAEMDRILASHAAESERINEEIARINEEAMRRHAEMLAEFEAEQAAADPQTQQLAAEREVELQRLRSQQNPDDWEDDEESEFYRPKSWLI